MPAKTDSVIIVGAGVFGLTLARELRRRGYDQVTVLDRHAPPVPDGSSVDISRVIRSEYADATYSKMAREAVAGWESEYALYYNESGILIVADEGGHPYLGEAKRQTQSQGGRIHVFDDASSIMETHGEFQNGTLSHCEGYTSPQAGWAQSGEAIRHLAEQCSNKGVKFLTGDHGCVDSLVLDGSRVSGVKVTDGSSHSADHVVLATGAWTGRLIDLSLSAVSTGQPVGFIQLTAEEAESLREMPIAIHLDSGFFVFPPTPDTHIMKCARHGYGYETRVSTTTPSGEQREISAPVLQCHDRRADFLPADAEESLREGLRRFFPLEIAERSFVKKHLCWYTDTPEGDFIVGHHPQLSGLFLATGGSGHAYKFLPVLGAYTCDVFEGLASPALREKWAYKAGDKNVLMHGDGSRGGPPRRRLDDREQQSFIGGEGISRAMA